MKKLTSILLALAMIFTLLPMGVFAADDTPFSDVNGKEYFSAAATVLEEIGILAGYPDGTFGAEKSITRAEMSAIVCRMIDKESDADESKGETVFDDVDADHWASGYINVASEEGIINGDGNGKFRPEDDVKYEEAIKMVVCALGFGDDVKVDEKDWSAGYIKAADDKGITGNLKGAKGKAATRGDIAVMVYNGLKSDLVAPTASLESGTYTGTKSVTLTTATKDADIYYTTDGTTPTVKSTKYTKAVSISKTTTLKAIAVKDGVLISDVMIADYTIKVSSGGGGGGGGGSSSSSKKYTVSFDLNYDGAPDAPASQSVQSGNVASEPIAPVREGYIFAGWYTDKEGIKQFIFDDVISSNITLYANWLKNDATSMKLENALSDLYILYSDGNNKNYVTKNIGLQTTIDDVTVEWMSDKPDIITNTGIVHRPPSEDVVVNLYATLNYDGSSINKDFSLKVINGDDVNGENIKDNTYEDLKDLNDGEMPLIVNDGNGNIESIDGKYSDILIHNEKEALKSFYSIKTIMQMSNPDEELEFVNATGDEDGMSYSFNQVYQNLEVYGRRSTVTVLNNGETTYLNTGYIPNININTTPNLQIEEIETKVKQYFNQNVEYNVSNIKLIVFAEENNIYHLSYLIPVSGADQEQNYFEGYIFVDAHSGDIINFEKTMCADHDVSSSGRDEFDIKRNFTTRFKLIDFYFFYMQNVERNLQVYKYNSNGNRRIGSEFNIWTDKTANSAYSNMITVYDWYKNVLGIDGVVNQGAEIPIIVHSNQLLSNAFWSGNNRNITFCENRDTDTATRTRAAAIDIVGHEFTHAVVQFTTGVLPYKNATGAINEGYADIFGALIKSDWNYGNNEGLTYPNAVKTGIWDHGADIGKTYRNIADPETTNQCARLYGTNYVQPNVNDLDGDGNGVHTNSTIISRAAYLMATRYGISNDRLAKIWYKSLSLGFNSNSDYYTVRRNVIKAAKIKSATDAEINKIMQAFDDVNITSQGNGIISGYVANADDRTAFIQNANIILKSKNGNVMQTLHTDSDGKYVINVAEGNYKLSVSADGYIPFDCNVTVISDEIKYIETLLLVDGDQQETRNIVGIITDSVTGSSISDVKLEIYEGWNTYEGNKVAEAKTNEYGNYSTTLHLGNYTIKLTKAGYVTDTFNIAVTKNSSQSKNGTMVPENSEEIPEGELRIRLRWGNTPSDLDSHLVGPSGDGVEKFHTYYSNKTYNYNSTRYADLDLDDTDGEGPETTTIYVQNSSGKYRFYVHDYSNRDSSSSKAMSNSGAIVQVFAGSRLVGTYPVPTSTVGTLWCVFEYDSETRKLNAVNTMSNYSEPSNVGLFSADDHQIHQNDESQMIFKDIFTNIK